MSNRFKPWRPESGMFGGVALGVAICLVLFSCVEKVTNPHSLKVGDCYEYMPDGNPFEEKQEVYKCILDIRDGYVKYSYIMKMKDGSWNCHDSSDTERWFNSRLYVKSSKIGKEFCE